MLRVVQEAETASLSQQLDSMKEEYEAKYSVLQTELDAKNALIAEQKQHLHLGSKELDDTRSSLNAAENLGSEMEARETALGHRLFTAERKNKEMNALLGQFSNSQKSLGDMHTRFYKSLDLLHQVGVRGVRCAWRDVCVYVGTIGVWEGRTGC